MEVTDRGSSGNRRGETYCLQRNQEEAVDIQTHEPARVPLGAPSPKTVPL